MKIKERNVLLEFIKNFYMTIFIYVFAQVMGKYINIYTVTVLGNATNAIIDRNLDYLRNNIVFLVLLLLISSFLVPSILFISSRLYDEVGVKFDILSYKKFIKQRKKLVDSYDLGELIYRIPEDEVSYTSGVLTLFGDGTIVLFVLIQSFYVMSCIHFSFALICLTLSTIPILVLKYFDNNLKNLYNLEKTAEGKILNSESAVIESFDFVKSHDIDVSVLNMLKGKYKNYYKIYKKQSFIIKALENFKEYFSLICEALIYALGSYYIASSQITIGDGVKFFGLYIILKENAKLLSLVLLSYFKFKVTSNRYSEWTCNNESFGHKKIDTINSISIKNLSFKYDNSHVLSNISLCINKGESILIEGKNGSGKSTLIKLLTGLYSDYEGEIYINTLNLKDLDIDCLRKNISVASQTSFFFNDSVINNIKVCSQGISTNKILELLKELDLYNLRNKIAGENGSELSGGEKQKISLARALLRNSPVTILDEPDTALDYKTRDYIINKFSNSHNILIVISHNISWAYALRGKKLSI